MFLSTNALSAVYGPSYFPNRVKPYQKWVNRYSTLYKVDPEIIEAQMAVESNFRDWVTGDDHKSQGLMQIQVPSATDVGFRGNASQLRNPRLNIKYGTKYLSWLMYRWKLSENDALDAYNRGIGKVLRRRYKGDWEKHKYVGKILCYQRAKKMNLSYSYCYKNFKNYLLAFVI